MEQYYTQCPSELAFSIPRFQELLKTKNIGRCFIYREQVESTMDVAKAQAEEKCPTGTLILAEEQTKGRGRKGRAWSSEGQGKSLYFTIVFHLNMEKASELIKLNLAIPLAVALTLKDEGLKTCGIKWPNDVWVIPEQSTTSNAKKISGMLIDSVQTGESLFGLAGVGINLNQSFMSSNNTRQAVEEKNELLNIATSYFDETNKTVEREKFLAHFCNTLEALLGLSQKEVLVLYKSNDILLGKDVTVIPADSKSAPYSAKAVGISKFGNLLVELNDGSGVKELVAEEVSIRPIF
ncbi:hypothetical protein FDP41_011772 [Naegleria fowleri]|uniref:BPL/LPL catalytic domain-containing protein n=1 Tax=Naegleria fowleri TaxID=5763 RepID=A0A6A5C498_NAEFO|nr:uncharacterized protein FDP41_011772 [Naegleria fowleri]KAF0981911.1 hypothetical protein FDP41_011772 [Naegleria fowleri]